MIGLQQVDSLKVTVRGERDMFVGVSAVRSIRFQKVKGHSGDPGNDRQTPWTAWRLACNTPPCPSAGGLRLARLLQCFLGWLTSVGAAVGCSRATTGMPVGGILMCRRPRRLFCLAVKVAGDSPPGSGHRNLHATATRWHPGHARTAQDTGRHHSETC